MLKNLLILKNELVSLEIGDVREQDPGMQYFGQIWNTLTPGNLVGYVSSFLPGAASLWSRGSVSSASMTGGGGSAAARKQMPQAAAASASAQSASAPDHFQDASEQLDELLRQAIGGFTQRWAGLLSDARAKKTGGKNMVKIEGDLEDMLQAAFSNQPEVIAKLKEAIQLHQEALNQKR